MGWADNFNIPGSFAEDHRRTQKRLQRQERRTPGAIGAIVTGEGLPERIFEGAQSAIPSSAFLVVAPGWAIDLQEGISNPQSFGALVQWRINITRTGAPIASGAGGNITNTLVGNLTDGWVPILTQSGHTVNNGRLAIFAINTDGSLQICNVEGGGGDVATGEPFSCSAFYIATNAEL